MSSPEIRLVDMSNQRGLLSDVMIKYIKDTLNKNEQIILLQNKRGMKGGGTQKIESVLYKLFPNIKVLRYDGDTIKRVGEYYHILDKFKDEKANILIGTQMIAKGLDYSNVSLVGIINTDIGLGIPDFRSGEKISQLIYQLVGRIGYKGKSSAAIIQSYDIDNSYIKSICNLKIEESYDRIIKERKELYYPPFSRLIKFLFLGEDKIKTQNKSKYFFSILKKNKDIIILGPSLAPIDYLDPYWRYQILVKCKKTYWQNFHRWINKNIPVLEVEQNKQSIKIRIDVDPISML